MNTSNNINPFESFELLVNFQNKKFDLKSKALLIGLNVYANHIAKKQTPINLTPYPALLQRLTGLSASSISRAKKNLVNLKLIKSQTNYVKQSASLLRFLKEKRKKVKPQTLFSLQELGKLPLSLITQNDMYSSQLIAAFNNKQKPANSSAAYYFLHNYYGNFGLNTKLKTTELVLITALVALCDAQGWTRPYNIDLDSILKVASISRSQFFLSKKILLDYGLVQLVATEKGKYSVYLSDDVINDKKHSLKFGMELQVVDNFNSLSVQEENQSSTENATPKESNFLNDALNTSTMGSNDTNANSLTQSRGERRLSQGVNINNGLLDQQNNTSSVDLQAKIKNLDQRNGQRENKLKAKIQNNLKRLNIPKQYWTAVTNTILVKICRRLNKLDFHVQQVLNKGNYLSILSIRRKYRITNYDAYIQSILTQWQCIGLNSSLELMEV